MDYTIFDFAGNAGVALIIGTYLLLQLNKMQGTDLAYSFLNAFGALLIIISLIYDFNLSAFIVEVFWMLISFVGIFRFFISRST